MNRRNEVMSKTVAEFRGCDSLYIAEITNDSNGVVSGGYTTGTPVKLCEVAQIAKTTEQNSETHFYDNKGMITIRAIGADTITLIVPAMFLDALASVTGAEIDTDTGTYIDRGNANEQKFYALGYRLKLTDGTYRYVWRLKGTFSNIPDETSNVESNNIDTNNQTVQFTSIDTVHEFTNGGSARAVVCDERDGKAQLGSWFNGVKTPDSLPAAVVTSNNSTPNSTP
jgi:phi13 family phage major tail protein